MDNMLHFCPSVTDGNRKRVGNLFTSPFYYLQNETKDENGNSRDDIINKCKAFLFLHTLEYNYDRCGAFFTKSNLDDLSEDRGSVNELRGSTDILPYGYVLFLGALIWRRSYITKNGRDPILYKSNSTQVFDKRIAGANYKPVSKDYTFLEKCYWSKYSTSGYDYFDMFLSLKPDVKYSDLVKCSLNQFIEKELVKVFIDFADGKFVEKIVPNCELRILYMKTDLASGVGQIPMAKNKKAKYLVFDYANFKYFYDICATKKCKDGKKQRKDEDWIKKTVAHSIRYYYTTTIETPQHIDRDDSVDKTVDIINMFRTTPYYQKGGNINIEDDNILLQYWAKPNKDSYNFVYYSEDGDCLCSFFSYKNPAQPTFMEIFKGLVMINTIPVPKNPDGISKDNLKQFYTGAKRYFETLYEVPTKKDIRRKEETGLSRDLNCELYMNLKNIWDRWLSFYYNNKETDSLNVKNFFQNQFIFIDSFYNNLYDVLKLNCNQILNEFIYNVNDQAKLGETTVAHLGNIVGKHRCMMFNFPDNFGFTNLGTKHDTLEDYKKNLFSPVPYNGMGEMQDHNKFVIIYTHSADRLETVDKNKFTNDSFDIWSYDDGRDVAPDIFNDGDEIKDTITPESRLPYKVPSFGVAYSRQNNTIWKNINISMDNFSVTEQSVKTESLITMKGSDNKSNVLFYGQDLFSVYQSYSYLVTIEMMGNAQIQPLMYFQLMNVPMFRGTYMIIRVEHKITPGNMTTTFTGMKMSRVQVPYTSEWFIFSNDKDYAVYDDESDDGWKLIHTNDGDVIDLCDNDFSDKIIRAVGEYSDTHWDKFINSVDSGYEIGDVEDDTSGFMFDPEQHEKDSYYILPQQANNSDNTTQTWQTWANLFKGSNKPVVGDVLFGYTREFEDANADDKIRCNHGAIYLGVHDGKIYVAEGTNNHTACYNYTGFNQVVRLDNSRFSGGMIRVVMHPGKVYVTQCERRVGTGDSNFDYDWVGDGSIITHPISNIGLNSKGIKPEDYGKVPDINNINLKEYEESWDKYGRKLMRSLVYEGFNSDMYVKGRKIPNVHINLTPLQASAIMAVFYHESFDYKLTKLGWNPTVHSGYNDGGYGIAQWTDGSRKHGNWERWYNGLSDTDKERLFPGGITNIKNGVENMTTVEQEAEYIKYEWRPGTGWVNDQLWGDDPTHTNGFKNLSGGLMYWNNDRFNHYDPGALFDMVYRFSVNYEHGKFPQCQDTSYNPRCKHAIAIYKLWLRDRGEI